ncbi:LysR family transcriptional regulator [Cocleimonas sp. KMM 6892]|uniref:LysR family transcriptional regulator n=1 Tax=unclassified Cocleimonas TaxID=2639732 RepID=UPI002DB7B904|nr:MULTISPECIES: LysR family transcriptional regulator [unclassified Cocleimonas]MEB8433402.1 LysR family transcriptional regulator [Cocleimonas sp. KMM 6892]MEC4716213.1 LysR family transcriptional regulator [Cocleimonas sp. KMM 6895]MEC4745894.1 LysR family transcriptional regulator [Cocleimonas sp. KMM 6896]
MQSATSKKFTQLLYSKTLGVFLAVCQHQSFTKAAKELDLSQSSVSQNIHKLEDTLGVSLFNREVRPITMNQDAILLRDLLEGQFSDIEQTISLIRERNKLKPIVKIGIIDSLSSSVAPALIHALSEQTRQISVLSGISPNIAHDLMNREVDIIITSDPLDGIEGLNRFFLCEEPHLLVLPKKSTLVDSADKWINLIDSGLPLVRYSRRSASGRLAENHFSRMRLTPSVKVEADTTRVLLSMVADGLGWAVSTPLCLLQCKDILSDVHIQPSPKPSFNRAIYIITRDKEYQGLVNIIQKECAQQLRENLLPKIGDNFPWTASEIIINEQANS